jgi:predicted O-methyltransferase YrrM
MASMTSPDAVETFSETLGPPADDVIREMDARADETGFPTVGPAVGGWLQQLVGLVDADRVYEFGSGYGYSAYWIARGLAADGELVLTEIDADELADAREYLERGEFEVTLRFEHGDAIDTIDDYDGPFQVVLIDNEKDRYVEALEAVRGKVPVGGVVVADNITGGPFAFEEIHRLVVDGRGDREGMVGGVADYIDHLRHDPALQTTLLPLGEGLSVSRRVA